MGGQQITLSERERVEVERSAAEARTTMLVQTDVDRYLNPPADTPHGLEYAFYLQGDAREKTVLDFGCGSGENLIPLRRRGANVIGIDISPDLIQLAQQRVDAAGVKVRKAIWNLDRWMLQHFPSLGYFATGKAASLRK
jgi:2-polyprenyl-3-methyl-5-hydroxy-6-metoxy-1,4-benzoquinol methylase